MRTPTPALLLCSFAFACATPTSPASETASEWEDERAEPTVEVPEEEALEEVVTDARIVLVDESGAPVTNASAVVIDQGYQLTLGSVDAPLEAGPDGIIELEARLPEESIVLAWAPGRAARRLELPEGEAPLEVRVELGAPTALHGRILGRGVVTHVWLSAADYEAPWPHFVRCDVDEDGRFQAQGLAAGVYRVSSVPIGGAPVLAANTEGEVRFLAADPGQVPSADHRFLDRELAADGRSHSLRVAFGLANVTGRVIDESGAPIADARVRLLTEGGRETSATTDANGWFSAGMRPAPYLHIMASHADYGVQSSDMSWDGWRHGGPIPDQPVHLTLRRGVVLFGRLLDADGAPIANRQLLLIPAYRGSGPWTSEARTDAAGGFRFERMVLGSFEVVPGSLRHWHPRDPGRYQRVAPAPTTEWLEAATAERAVELHMEEYELVAVPIQVGPNAAQVELWTRWGPDLYTGSAPNVADGRVRAVMERGVAHELWVGPFVRGQSLVAPWTRSEEPDWSGAPERGLQLSLTP